MMKSTKKTKKSLVGVEAVVLAPAKPASVQSTSTIARHSISTVPPEPVKVVPVPPAAPIKPAAPVAAQAVMAITETRQAARVALQLVEPAAKQVYVAGSFNGWKPDTTPLVPVGEGRWKGDLKLRPGKHEYLFVVDGQWRPDPNAKESVQNPFGGRNSVVRVSE